MSLMDLKWPPGLESQTPTPDAGASAPNEANDSDEAHESKVLACRPTFDQLKSLDWNQGPSRMALINI